MKDEIKEILDYWRFYINEPNNYKLLNVRFDEIKKVLDYITNLQQLYNKSLEDNVRESKRRMELQEEKQKIIHTNIVQKKQLNNKIKKLQQENKQLQTAVNNCKQRNDKAIEYIEEDIKGNYFKRYDDEIYKMCDDLLEILGDKENV